MSTVGAARSLFCDSHCNAPDSPCNTPCLPRRHSMSDFKCPGDITPIEDSLLRTPKPTYYDEDSIRAQLLHRLQCERNGFDNPIWSPEIVSLVRSLHCLLLVLCKLK